MILVAVLILTAISLFVNKKTTVESSVESKNLVGTIVMWNPLNSETTPPPSWAVCDGSTIKFTDASGNDKTYILPDLRGRFIVGVNKGSVWNNKNIGVTLLTDNSVNDPTYGGSTALTKYDVADKGGEEKHKLTIDEMPKHNHSINPSAFSQGTQVADSPVFDPNENSMNLLSSTGDAGNDAAHNTIPPYYAAIYIIKIY